MAAQHSWSVSLPTVPNNSRCSTTMPSAILLGPRTLGALTLSAVLLTLGLLVLVHNPRAKLNRFFGFAVLTIVGWVLAISFALTTTDPLRAATLGRLGFACAATIPFALLCVFHAFPVSPIPTFRRTLFALGLLCLLFIVLSVSPLIVAAARVDVTQAHFIYGPLYPAFSGYVVSCFSFAMYLLWRKVRAASGLRKLQLRYLLLGILSGGAGVITTNLIIPLVWRTSRFSVLGPYFSLLLVSFSAHAIIRHRLLDIRLFVKQGAVYIAAASVAGILFTLVIWLIAIQTEHLEHIGLPIQVALALALALAFQPIKQWIGARLDQYVYRETYSYRDTIRDASSKISATLDAHSLATYLCDVTSRTLRPEFVTLFLLEPDSLRLRLAATHRTLLPDADAAPASLLPDSPLITFLAHSQLPLVGDELQHKPRDPDHIAAVLALADLGAAAALPMLSEQRLVGLFLIGPKLSGDAYFADDLQLLTTLANQAAIAAKNAHLYRQVLIANEYIHNILTTMDSAVISIDSLGQVVMANAAAARLTGIPSSHLSTLTMAQLPSPISSQLEVTLTDGMARLQIEGALPTTSSLTVPVVCSSSALRDDRGTISGALIVFNDLSNVKRLELENRRVERLASVGALSAGIAHEIKNPLVAIRTFAELLPERFLDLEFREGFSKVVLREIERIDALVARLRGLASPPPSLAARIDLREPINDTIDLLRGQLELTHTTITRHFSDARPIILGDSAQLTQLFLNLIQNAIEAIGSDGRIDISVTRHGTAGSDRVLVRVSDSGPGIPDSIRTSIFHPFFTTKNTGSGLGLAICRGIADAHRAQITVEPHRHSHGTTMIVDFPVATDAPVSAQHEALLGWRPES